LAALSGRVTNSLVCFSSLHRGSAPGPAGLHRNKHFHGGGPAEATSRSFTSKFAHAVPGSLVTSGRISCLALPSRSPTRGAHGARSEHERARARGRPGTAPGDQPSTIARAGALSGRRQCRHRGAAPQQGRRQSCPAKRLLAQRPGKPRRPFRGVSCKRPAGGGRLGPLRGSFPSGQSRAGLSVT
jgi:hypothetical protein